MKIFDFKNPKHIQILREEIQRAKSILLEESSYNEDNIWSSMTEDERYDAISGVADDEGPDLADKYVDEVWDNIPDDITDLIDLSNFQLAKNDQSGRNYLNGVKHMRDVKFKHEDNYEQVKQAIQTLVDKFCEKIGRPFDMLTTKQAMDLNIKVQRLLGSMESRPTSNVKDSDVIGSMIAADKASGKYHRGSLGD